MKLVLYDAQDRPIQGMKSANVPLAVPPGFWRYLYNVRYLGDSTVTARNGLGATLGTVGSDGSPRGLATFSFNGTVTHFAAIRNVGGTATLVYKSTDAVTWTEITASSGKYGSTRFSTDGQVFFEVAAHPRTPQTDLLIIQNGADLPRVYDGTNTVVHEAVVGDAKGATIPLVATFDGYSTIYNAGNTDVTASGTKNAARLNFADAGASATDNYLVLTATSAVGTTYYARVVGTSAISSSAANKQFFIVMDSAYQNWFDHFKVTIDDDAGDSTVLWDPTDTTGVYARPFPIPMSVTTKLDMGTMNMWVFTINAASTAVLTNYKALSLEWMAGSLSATKTANVYAFGCGGGVFPGDTQWCIARYNSGSRAYSPAYIYNQTLGARLRDIGGPQNRNDRIPVSPLAYYQWKAQYTYTTAAEVAKGVDFATFFYRRTDNVKFAPCVNVTLATYGGSWSASGTAGTINDVTLDASAFVPGAGAASEWMVPDEQHMTIPIGKGMLKTNGRLFVAAKGDSVNGPGLYFSALDNPFDFRVNADPNQGEYSPSANVVSGEVSQRALSSYTDNFNVSQVYFWTDRWLYSIGGVLTSDLSKMRRLSPHGTLNPYTCREYLGRVIWLDQENHVRISNGGKPDNLSRFEVDDQFDAIPGAYRDDVCAEVFGDRYGIWYAPEGGTANKRRLVWNCLFEKWEAIDTYATLDVAFASKWTDTGGVRKLLTIGSDRTTRLCDLEGQLTDAGTAITVYMQSWAITGDPQTPDDWGELTLRESAILADQKAATWTVTRTFPPTGGTLSGTIATTAGSYWNWAWETLNLATASDNAFGIAGIYEITADTSNGARLYNISVLAENTGGGPDSA